MSRRNPFKIRACPSCGQVYRTITVKARTGKALLCYPPGSSEPVETCIACGKLLQAKFLRRLKTQPRLAAYQGKRKDFVDD